MNLLTVQVTTWNDEKIIEDFLTWYRQRVPECHFIVWDNESDDRTVEICKSYGAEIHPFATNGEMDEHTLINIRNNGWKHANSEYVCVVDSDEWVDIHEEDLLDNLETMEWNVCKCLGFEMFGKEGDTMDDLVYGVQNGGYSKPILFYKDHIKDIGLQAGSHKSRPVAKEGYEIKWKEGWPNLYHTKHRSWEYVLERHHLQAARRSQRSAMMGWNFHYQLPDETHKEYYETGMKNRVKVR